MAWGYKATITIDDTKVSGTGNLTGFPILVSGTYDGTGSEPDLRVTGIGGNVTSSSGYDIEFFSDEALTTKLDHEIESYSPTTGAINMWVNIPTLDGDAPTVIYIAYGNADITTNQSSTEVWDNDYLAVYHLKETSGGSGAIKDSTSYGNHGTDTSSPTLGAEGKVGYGIDFESDSNTYIDCGDFDPTPSMTIEAWAKPETVPGGTAEAMLVSKDESGGSSFDLEVFWSTHLYAENLNQAVVISSAVVSEVGTWAYVVGRYDADTNLGQMFIDGVSSGAGGSYSTDINTNSTHVRIGNRGYGGYNHPFDGIIDEVRISNIPRTAEWIATTFATINAPSSFYAMGDEEAGGGTSTSTSSSTSTTSSSTSTTTTTLPPDKDYSHGDVDSLPANDTDLEHEFVSADYTTVATNDEQYVDEPYTQLNGVFLFKDQNANSTDGITVEWNGKSSLAPSSSVVTLQIYDRDGTTWEDVDTDNETGANTDFTLTGTITSDLDHYYDENHWVAFRVVQ